MPTPWAYANHSERVEDGRHANRIAVSMPFRLSAALLLLSLVRFATLSAAPPTRLWITHQSNDPAKAVINWETAQPTPSTVAYGEGWGLGSKATQQELTTLHHVEIPLPKKDMTYNF